MAKADNELILISLLDNFRLLNSENKQLVIKFVFSLMKRQLASDVEEAELEEVKEIQKQ